MRAIIADDEPLLRHHLDQLLADLWPELEIVGKAADGQQALDLCQNLGVDIVFLDIRMPGLDGIAVAAELNKQPKTPIVVFITAYDEYAVQAFEQQAVDYLLKPIDEDRLAKACDRIQRRLASQESGAPSGPDLSALVQQLSRVKPEYLQWIRASKGEDIQLVACADVDAFVAEDKYTTLYTNEGQLLIRTPLKELKEQLDPDQFWHIHRATIVRVAGINKVSKGLTGNLTVHMSDGREYAVSRRAAALFKSM